MRKVLTTGIVLASIWLYACTQFVSEPAFEYGHITNEVINSITPVEVADEEKSSNDIIVNNSSKYTITEDEVQDFTHPVVTGIEIIETTYINTCVLEYLVDSLGVSVKIEESSDGRYTNSYRMLVYDLDNNLMQSVVLDHTIIIDVTFFDVNFDGYDDAIIETGGTLNSSFHMYTWDSTNRCFSRTQFVGFDLLANYELHEGYIVNWVKETHYIGYKQILVWNENSLTLVSNERYVLESSK